MSFMEYDTTPEFDSSFLKLTRKNRALRLRLIKKIAQILEKPTIGDPKRNRLRHVRGSHVDPYVIVYRIKGNRIQFLYVENHDFVYQKAAEILERLERDEA
jgi:mRNA-degrading endonuclease RelE of RelBE toxin-antitoxin system